MLTIGLTNVIGFKIDEVKDSIFNLPPVKGFRKWMGYFKRIMQLSGKIHVLKKDIAYVKGNYNYLGLEQKMDSYAEFSYKVETTINFLRKKMDSTPATSFLDVLFYSYIKDFIEVMTNAERDFFALTYPNSKSLDDPEFVAQLDKDYADAPQFTK